MKVLLVKTSSLGDVIHVMPAVTEAFANVADLDITWVVEEAFCDIAASHPGVSEVVPVAVRRWRKSPVACWGEIQAFRRRIGSEQYDLVIDSQGLIKSALIASSANGPRHGFDAGSAREKAATLLYGMKHAVATDEHAVMRQKKLLASALGYQVHDDIDYGLVGGDPVNGSILLLHGTTWVSKEWPESAWHQLAALVTAAGFPVVIAGGNEVEVRRARKIADGLQNVEVLAEPPLGELIENIRNAAGVVSVDTGLGHLAAAFARPLIGLYGATDPRLTGMTGPGSEVILSNHLPCIPCRKRTCQFPLTDDSSKIHPPCFANTTPENVWRALQQQIGKQKINPA